MDPSGLLHEYGRVGLIEGRVAGLTALDIRFAPACAVVRLGGARTGAG